MYKKNKHIHFVGIGGIGMSGIAELLLNLGYKVSGADILDTEITRRLKSLGGAIYIGHKEEHIENAEVVVTSTAVKIDNPEVVAAKRNHVPVIRRAEMLAELMRLKKYGIAIAGSHGKTSTTSLVGWVLANAGLDPTVVIGGQVDNFGSNAKLGEGEFLVAEADESDGSFLHLAPVVEVITNIDFEHLDYYDSLDDIKEVFLEFINKIPFYGVAVICLDDPNIAELLPAMGKRLMTYGLSAQADVYARDIKTSGLMTRFEVCAGSDVLGMIEVPLVGNHNVQNSLAAVAIGLELAIPFATIAKALKSFTGVRRRLQIKGEVNGITVVDDYGHHPSEIKATLGAMRLAWPKRRIVAMFQPHRYTRTQGLYKEFCTAFHDADLLYVTDIYAASEAPIEGVDGAWLLDGINSHGQKDTHYVPEWNQLPALVAQVVKDGDVVLTLGAGNIYRAGEELLELLRRTKADEEAGESEGL